MDRCALGDGFRNDRGRPIFLNDRTSTLHACHKVELLENLHLGSDALQRYYHTSGNGLSRVRHRSCFAFGCVVDVAFPFFVSRLDSMIVIFFGVFQLSFLL